MLLEVRQNTKAHFLFGPVLLGFLTIFTKSQASSPFEALNSVCLSRYQSDASGGEAGDQGSLSSWNSDIGFLSILKKSQASSPFEALNSVCLSRYQSDVIPPIQMRWRTMAFSRVSTGESDIPSSGDMKHEPKFKPLQGNLAFF